MTTAGCILLQVAMQFKQMLALGYVVASRTNAVRIKDGTKKEPGVVAWLAN